jgi:hypothetical protein
MLMSNSLDLPCVPVLPCFVTFPLTIFLSFLFLYLCLPAASFIAYLSPSIYVPYMLTSPYVQVNESMYSWYMGLLCCSKSWVGIVYSSRRSILHTCIHYCYVRLLIALVPTDDLLFILTQDGQVNNNSMDSTHVMQLLSKHRPEFQSFSAKHAAQLEKYLLEENEQRFDA